MQTLAEWLARKPKVKAPKKPLRRSVRVRKVSAKRSRENRIYSVKRKAFLEAHPYCMAYARITAYCCAEVSRIDLSSHWPSPIATEIHHTRKPKCKYLNDESTWLAVCRWSHDWIEANKCTARELGLLF